MTCIYRFFTCLILVLVFAGINSVCAQPTSQTSKSRFWLSGGLGLSTLGSIAGSANASIQFKRILFTLRTTANSASLFGDEFFDVGLLVGLASQGRGGHASVSVGFARVTGSRSDGLDLFGTGAGREDIDPTFGLPIEVQLFGNIGRILGLGLYAYANVNTEQIFGGITVNLRFGKLR
ncbi:hypothetical protein KJ656_07910 [bacterium]|nr:hypothetical protein [bacterium]